MKKYDVVALGELLIDFTYNGVSSQQNGLFEANPGGAPCNVLAMLQKLDRKTAFIGKVGKDMFGELLKEKVSQQGIDLSGLCFDEKVNTTLAFVHTKADGDRSFSFYRNPGADMMLTSSEVPAGLIMDTRLFHFGSLSMTDPIVEEATKYAINIAKKANAIVSFDPNLRPPLWKNLDDARRKISYGLSVCDVLKISDNEIQFVSGLDDLDAGVSYIQEKYQIPFICATYGKEGSKAYCNGKEIFCPAFLQKNTIETTGAGDVFCASMLHYVLKYGISMTEEQLKEMLTMANAAASIITTRRGALCVMPDKKEIDELIHENK